ncbi:hypothetical protein CHARACLAT_004301 [Characodon lateralis]|uniref:Uncharacterized protein n=1 Tax=Characodon lateralis TaxID=208331 RepID=A0ABU7F0P8_9TELE|nr:hypothetical protein [Characodon lateralis]
MTQLPERFTLSESSLISPARWCQGWAGEEEDTRESPHKEVAFPQQHSHSKGRRALALLLVFENVVYFPVLSW